MTRLRAARPIPYSKRRRRHAVRSRSLFAEHLEDRLLLALPPGSIPSAIDPALTEQTLFAPHLSRLTIAADPAGAASRFYRFAFDGPSFDVLAEFQLKGPVGDAGLALYDADGNLITNVDQDLDASAFGNETLEAEFETRVVYVLGVFFSPAGPPADYVIDLTTAEQVLNSPMALDPVQGTATRDANSGEDTFNSPRDVDYYMLDLTNAGAQGTITVTPTGLDVHVAATLFRRSNAMQPWEPIAAGMDVTNPETEAPVVLGISALPNRNLTDGQYLLAVAPRGFDTAARSYKIDVTVDGLLAPVSLSQPQIGSATDLRTPPPVALGQAQSVSNAVLDPAGEQLFRFRAPADGIAHLEVVPTNAGFDPLVSIYSIGCVDVLFDVASRSDAGTLDHEVPVSAGCEYAVRVADVGEDEGSGFTLTIAAAYVPVVIPMGSSPSQATLTLGTNEVARFYRVDLTPGADVLAIELAPDDPGQVDPLAAWVIVRGVNLPPLVAQASAGQPLELAIAVSGLLGPFDIYLAAVSGSDGGTLHVGQLDLPDELEIDDLAGAKLGLDGTIGPNSPDPATAQAALQPAGPFGTLSGLSFFQLLNLPDDPPAKISVDGAAGGRAVLGHYVESGGALRLAGLSVPDSVDHAELVEKLSNEDLHGLAAFSVAFAAAGTLQFQVAGTPPIGVPVGMVPEPPPDLATQPPDNPKEPPDPPTPDNPPFFSVLRIREVTLEQEYEQHLWETVLPFNLKSGAPGVPEVTLTPASPQGSLQVRLSVYFSDTLQQIGQAVMNAPGQEVKFSLAATPAQLKQKKLLFRVEPEPSQLGDGIYTLTMTVETDNPHPFEVLEVGWAYPTADANGPDNVFLTADDLDCFPDDPQLDSCVVPKFGDFPSDEPVIDIVQNQFGDGHYDGGHLTCPLPYNNVLCNFGPGGSGSVDLYRFWVGGPGPIIVRTVPIPDPDNPGGPTVNTNIALYRPHFANGVIDVLVRVPDVAPSFDWFPVDREVIDAQVYINDGPVDSCHGSGCYAPPEMYFVVVKNQEGTTGPYRIEVDAPSFPLLGAPGSGLPTFGCDAECRFQMALEEQVAYIPPVAGGSRAIKPNFVGNFHEFLGYFPVQLPDDHTGTLHVEGQTFNLWDFDLFDWAGNRIDGSVTDHENDPLPPQTEADFDVSVANGPQLQTVVLRAKEQGAVSNDQSTITVSAMRGPGGGPALPNAFPLNAPAPRLLPTSPLGETCHAYGSDASDCAAAAAFQDAFSAAHEVRTYAFSAAAGPITVTVQPDSFSDLTLRFGVYADKDGDSDLDLIAWDETGSNARASQHGITTTVLLPEFRQPHQSRRMELDPYGPDRLTKPALATRDAGFDTAPYHRVVLYVQAMNAPADGGFSISVDGAADRPMLDRILAINPLTGSSDAAVDSNGRRWVRLDVPDGAAGSVQLSVQLANSDGCEGNLCIPTTTVRYDLFEAPHAAVVNLDTTSFFSTPGDLIATQTLETVLSNPTFTLPNAVVGGRSYYLRVGRVFDADDMVMLSASVSLPKATMPGVGKPPATFNPHLENLQPVVRANPRPGGNFYVPAPSAKPVAFWVGSAGVATLTANVDDASNRYLALYRGTLACPEVCSLANADGDLVDYSNHADYDGTGEYELEAYLEPGMYFLVTNDASPNSMSGILPGFVPEDIVLDPNFGSSNLPNLQDVDESQPLNLRLDSFRSSFYRVVAPLGSQNGMIANAVGLSCEGQFENGTGTLAVWRPVTPQFFAEVVVPQQLDDPAQSCDGYVAAGNVMSAPPFAQFWLGFHRDRLASTAAISATFVVPFSGTPDLVVEPLRVSPNDGETRVDVRVLNVGYAPAFGPLDALFQYTDTSTPSGDVTVSEMVEHTLGPFAFRNRVMPWPPKRPTDAISYITDVPGGDFADIDELDETNNDDTRMLCEPIARPENPGDCHRPTITVRLAHPPMDAHPAADTWGRYVSGVAGQNTQIIFVMHDDDDFLDSDHDGLQDPGEASVDTDGDGTSDLYRAFGHRPSLKPEAPGAYGPTLILGPEPIHTLQWPFGSMHATAPSNPNLFDLVARDRYGLKSDQLLQKVQVAGYPGWLHEPSTLTFDPATRLFHIDFHNEFINYHKNVNQILGASIPLIGESDNQFLIEIDAETTASLNPNQPILAPAFAHVQLKFLDQNVFNETYGGSTPVTDHLTIEAELAIDSVSLEATAVKITVLFLNYNVFHFESPEITLFAYGIPGVASINANIQFGIDVDLNAGVSLGITPGIVQNLLEPPVPLGLLAPSFIEPSATLLANLAGEVELLGFDIAEVFGGVSFTLFVTFGIDETDPTTVISFESLFNNFFNATCFALTGQVGVLFGAELLGITIFELDYDFPPFDIGNTCDEGILTPNGIRGANSNSQALAAALGARSAGELVAILSHVQGHDPETFIETVFGGNELVGNALGIASSPQLVVDPTRDRRMFVQVVDADPNDAMNRGNLAFSEFAAGSWSPLTTLSEAAHVSSPALAYTNDPIDSPGTPAVVVYQALDGAGDPALLTRNQFLSGQDIRSRYFDGTSWGAATLVTDDSLNPLYDSNPVLAFGTSPGLGQPAPGVLAWVRNGNPAPVAAAGPNAGKLNRSANEIAVAVWNPATAQWSPPQVLTANSESDSNPAAYVAENGKAYVTWLHDTPSGNEIMFSVLDGGAWSAPAALPIIGLPATGKIQALALGSEAPGRIDVLIAHATEPGPNQSVDSRLYNRVTTLGGFAQPAALETVADTANFSHVRTLPLGPGQGMAAFWQQSDGVTNEIYVSTIGGGSSTWSDATQLTSGSALEFSPAVAVNPDGSFQVLYAMRDAVQFGPQPVSALTCPGINSPADAPPVAGNVCTHTVMPLPELTFSNPTHFPYADHAPSGPLSIAHARIANTGLVGTELEIAYFVGQPSEANPPLAAHSIALGAGNHYDVKYPFPILAGTNDYCIRLSAADGLEAFNPDDNTSCATLVGLPDIELVQVTPDVAQPQGGDMIQLAATVRNRSDQPIGSFDIAFTLDQPTMIDEDSADPSNPLTPKILKLLLGSAGVSGLAPFEEKTVSVPWTVPADGSDRFDFVITAVADPVDPSDPSDDGSVSEATELNNSAATFLRARADAAVVRIEQFDAVLELTTILPAVQATVLNYSGVDNVEVVGQVSNLGVADLTNVPVELYWSRNDGDMQSVATAVIASLPAGSVAPVMFIADGLAGLNRYRIVADPNATLRDADWSNNVDQALLILQGLPDLVVGDVTRDPPDATGPLASIRAQIQNVGIDDARRIRVEAFIGNPSAGGLLVGRSDVDHLAPLSEAVVAIALDQAKLAGRSNVDLCVVIDRLEKILEKSDRNNVKCTRFTTDREGPKVTGVETSGGRAGVTAVTVSFNEPLDARTAGLAANYGLFAAGRDKRLGTRDDMAIAIAAVEYDPTSMSVVVTPVRAIAVNQFFDLVVSPEVRDRSGNQLDGDCDGTNGDAFRVTIGRGNRLSYSDRNGDKVSLLATNATLELTRASDGEGLDLRVIPPDGAAAARGGLAGSVKKSKKTGDGITSLRSLAVPAGITDTLPRCAPGATNCFEIGDARSAAVDALLAGASFAGRGDDERLSDREDVADEDDMKRARRRRR